jgi:hypothetical protein
MDDGFGLIILVGNYVRSGQAMHGMSFCSKESLFRVYFGSDLVPINEYGFEPYRVQSWLGLNKIRLD